MKKKTILIAILILISYSGLIWLVRTVPLAKTIAKWVVGIAMGVWFLDWLIGQFAGLCSDNLQEWLAAAFLPLSAILLALFPIIMAVVLK